MTSTGSWQPIGNDTLQNAGAMLALVLLSGTPLKPSEPVEVVVGGKENPYMQGYCDALRFLLERSQEKSK